MPERTKARISADRVAWFALVAIPVVVPLALTNLSALGVAHPLTDDVFNVPKLLALGVLTGLALVAWAVAILRQEIELRTQPLGALCALFLGLVALSTVFAVHVPTAVFGGVEYKFGLVGFVLCAALLVLATQLVRTAAQARMLLRATFVGGVLVAGYALTQVAGHDPLRWAALDPWMTGRGFATIGNPDLLAGYLIFPLAAGPVLALTQKNRYWRAADWVGFSIVASSILFALARAAWIGGAVAVGVIAVVVVRGRVSVDRVDKLFIGGTAALLAASSLATKYASGTSIGQRVTEAASLSGTAGSGRVFLWREALLAITRHPFLGVGPDSYRLAWYPVRVAQDVAFAGFSGIADDPHNYVLALAATLGIPAALVGITLLCSVLWRSRSGISPAGTPARLALTGWWAAVLGYSVCLLFTPNFLGTSALLWIGMGVLLAPMAAEFGAKGWQRWAVTAAAGVLAIVFLVVPMLTFAADAQLVESKASSPVDALAHVRLAASFAPWSYAYQAAVTDVLSERARTALRGSDQNTASQAVADASRAFEDLRAFEPAEYETYVQYSALLNDAAPLLGDSAYQRAADIAAEGINVQPNGLAARMMRARALFALKRYTEAAATLESTWRLDPSLPQPGVLYIDALVKSNQRPKAAQVAKQLLAVFPSDPEVRRVGRESGAR